MMTKDNIVSRINSLMYEELYVYDEIKYDLDDAIIEINDALNSKFPMMSDVFTDTRNTYTYDIPENIEEEIEAQTDVPIFPEKYIRSVVIPFTVNKLFRRQMEYGPEQQTAQTDFDKGLTKMFRDHFYKVPDIFKELEGGVIETEIETYTEEEDDDEWLNDLT